MILRAGSSCPSAPSLPYPPRSNGSSLARPHDYDKSFTISSGGETHTFDSFECAIHLLAPKCAHCDCRIIGHGVEAGSAMFCCVHCAERSGVHGLRDRKNDQAATSEGKRA